MVVRDIAIDAAIERAFEKYGNERSSLIPVLHEIQNEYRYLPEEALRTISEEMNISLVDVYGVATFFRAFSLKPKGKHSIVLCMGTACHVRNSRGLLDEARRFLGIEPGETTEDMMFTLETVNCLGACALGPVAVIDGEYHGQMTPAKMERLLKKMAKEEGI